MINKITFQGLKGRNAEINLSTFTVLTGENAQGKSAIRDAALLGIFGSHPDLPNTNQGVMEICAGTALAVTLETSLGAMTKTWIRKGKSVKFEASGIEIPMPIEALDGQSFLRLSHRDKIALVADLTGGRQNEDEIRKKVQDLCQDIESNSKALQAKLGPSVLADAGEKPMLSEWVLGVIAEVKEINLELGRTLERHTKAIQANTENQADEIPEFDAGAYEQLLGMRGTLEAKIKALEAEYETAQAAQETFARKAELEALVGNITWESAEAIWEEGNNAEIARNTRLRAVEADISHHDEIIRSLRLDLKAKQTAIESIQRDQVEIPSFTPEMSYMDACLVKDETEKSLNQSGIRKAQLEERRRTLSANIKALEAGTCPTCGQTGETLAGVREYLVNDLQDCEQALAQEKEQIARETTRRDKAKLHVDKFEAITKARKENQERQIRIDELLQQIVPIEVGKNARIEARTELQVELGRIENEVLPDPCGKIYRAWKELWAIKVPACREPEEIARHQDATRAALDELEETIEDARTRKAARDIWEGNATASRQAQEMAQKAAESRDQVKTALKGLEALASEITVGAFRSALRLASDEFLDWGIPNLDVRGEDWEIGRYTHEGQWVGYKTFSGAERVMLEVALQIAIAGQTSLRTVMVDEVSRLSRKNKARLVRALSAALGKHAIEQVILIDHDSEFFAQDEITAIPDLTVLQVPDLLA